MMKYNVKKIVEEKNEKIGVLEMRTMLMYYLKGLNNTKNLKLRIISAKSESELLNILDEYEREIM